MTDNQVVGLTLFGEARGESIEGIVGVASVIRNRLQLNFRKAKSYTDVCLAKEQFSCWNETDPNSDLLKEYRAKLEAGENITDIFWRQCLYIANGITGWSLRDNTRGATHYLVSSLFHSENCPKWAATAKVTATLGNHTFLIAL